jgi:hypothetical protein
LGLIEPQDDADVFVYISAVDVVDLDRLAAVPARCVADPITHK